MLIAYNNDVQHNNRWYHIQTEDNGIKDGHITTTVFFSGQILDSKTTSYKEAIAGVNNEEQINAIIKEMMIKQHQAYYRRLDEGTYDAQMQNSQPHGTSNSSVGAKVAVVSPSMASGNGASRLENSQRPDILRASQQVASIAKSAGVHSISSISPRADMGQPASNLASQMPKTSNAAPAPINAPSRSVQPRIIQSISVPRSNAVEAVRLSIVNHAYKGIVWPNDDLAIDVLVATLLEKA